MASIFTTLVLPRREYDSIPPDSPESDAKQIDAQHLDIVNISLVNSGGQYVHRKSFSSDDFGGTANAKSVPVRQNSASAVLGQWTASAASMLADTLMSGTQYVQTITSGAGPIRLSPDSSQNRDSGSQNWTSVVNAHKHRVGLYDPAKPGSDEYDNADDPCREGKGSLNAVRRRQTAPVQQHYPSTCRGIDITYFQGGAGQQKASGTYVNDLIARFTAPKYSPTKLD